MIRQLVPRIRAAARVTLVAMAATCALSLVACTSPHSRAATPPPPSSKGTHTASASPTPAGAPQPAVKTPVCRTAQLTITVVRSGAAAGTSGGYIRFTSHASGPCHLTGWPLLVPLTAAGVPGPVRRVTSTMFGPYKPSARVVTLEPGQAAEAVFTAGDNPVGEATSCPPPYRHLRVTPPGNAGSVLVSSWLSFLGAYLPACTTIEISPVVPPSALYQG